jgi:hypothetical protein
MEELRLTNRMKFSLCVLLAVSAIVAALSGCKAKSQSAFSPEQKALIDAARAIPRDQPPGGVPFMDAGLDNRSRTVSELVEIFMNNRNWTEALPEKELASWQRTQAYASPPVLIHTKQTDAAFRLIQLGPRAKAAAAAMVEALTNSTVLTRQWALRQKGIDPLVEKDADASNRHWAIRVLQAIGAASPVVVPALVSMLYASGKENEPYGFESAEALKIISLSDTNVLPAVIAKLETNPESPQAKNAVRVADGIGAEAGAAVSGLISLLDRTNACDEVVTALTSIGSKAAPAVPALLRHYERLQGDDKFAQRRCLVIAFGRIGPGASEAVPLLRGLTDRHSDLDAVRALWRIDPQFAQTAINIAVKQLQFWNVGAITLLGEIGPPAKSTVPVLLEKLKSPPNDQILFNLAWAVWRIDPAQKERIVPVFERLRTSEGRYPWVELPLDAAGALWHVQPERREELRPAVVAMLKEWKKGTGAGTGRAEMKPLQPALESIRDDPKLVELHPWAVLALRQINRVGAEFWQR